MKGAPRYAAAAVVLLSVSTISRPASAAWPHDSHTHVPVCGALGDQSLPTSCSDGNGGAIIAWQDARSGSTNLNIFAQRVNAAGTPLWTTNGVQVTTALNNQAAPAIVTDGQGGCIIAWVDQRVGPSNGDIYAVRLTASGTVAPGWVSGGTAVSTTVNDEYQVAIASDGTAGAWITWTRRFGAPDQDVIVDHLIANGGFGPGFGLNGVATTTIASVQYEPAIAADGSGGAFVVWSDGRNGDTEIWEQHFTSAGAILNPAGGVPVYDSSYEDQNPAVVSDGFGGAWVATVLQANLSAVGPIGPIFVTHVASSGPGGVTTSAGSMNSYQGGPALLADGSGGVFVAFLDFGGLSSQTTYVQHVGPAGTQLWGTNGLALSATAYPAPTVPRVGLISDGSGGIVAAWTDTRNLNLDVYAQRVTANGSVVWASGGAAIADLLLYQSEPTLVGDGAGGAIVAWTDNRGGVENDLYAQRIERFGKLGSPEPVIADVSDVLGDQGGRVRISWVASYLDQAPNDPIDSYTIWRQLPAGMANAAVSEGATLLRPGESPARFEGRVVRATISAAGAFYWEYVGSQIARGFSGYSYSASTAGDSVAGSNPYTVFMVEAEQSSAGSFWSSAPDSGYSVDNLPPVTPSPFTASYASGVTHLHWGANHETDFALYQLHRGSDPSFTPSEATRIAAITDTGYADPAGGFHGYYKLAAVDIHGNRSSFALVGPSTTVDVESSPPAGRFGLVLIGPNPARGGTGLRLDVPRAGTVDLAVFDLQGRRVRSLMGGDLAAGEHDAGWDGRDDAGGRAAPGIYVVRFSAAGRTVTRRLALLR